jgi:hypothetical protein
MTLFTNSYRPLAVCRLRAFIASRE